MSGYKWKDVVISLGGREISTKSLEYNPMKEKLRRGIHEFMRNSPLVGGIPKPPTAIIMHAYDWGKIWYEIQSQQDHASSDKRFEGIKVYTTYNDLTEGDFVIA